MSARAIDFLIVGGGLAGAYCASELRKRGAEGSILLAGREPEPPYERPPLSKEYLRGEASRADAYVNPPDWYARERCRAADPDERDVARPGGADGEAPGRRGGRIRARRCWRPARTSTSCGSRAPSWRGSTTCARSGTPTRSARRPRRRERVIMIGGSYIGCEVAASLTRARPRSDRRDDRGGGAVEDVRRRGRPFLPRDARSPRRRAARRRGARGVRGRRAGERHRDEERAHRRGRPGRRRGGRPARRDARRAGRAARSRTGSSATRGSRARRRGSSPPAMSAPMTASIHGRRLRVEHWDVALQQGRYAARAMLGETEPYRELPYFFSDLADWASLEYVGPAEDWDEVVWRGDRDVGEFSAWYLSRRRGPGRARRRQVRGPGPRADPDRDRRRRLGRARGARRPDSELESVGR